MIMIWIVIMTITVPLENTCYLKTGLAGSWAEARAQCWAWGGELALPLTSNTSTPNSWLQVRHPGVTCNMI